MSPRELKALIIEIDALKESHRYEEALERLDRTVAEQPHLAVAHSLRGAILRSMGRTEEALIAQERALAEDPIHPAILRQKGVVLHDLGRYTDALAAYDLSLEHDAGNSLTWHSKGSTLAHLHRYAESADAYKQAIALGPASSDLLDGATAIFIKAKRWSDAVASSEQVLSLLHDPFEVARMWRMNGYALLHLRRRHEALAAFEQAVALAPSDVASWEGKIMALFRLRRYRQGWQAFQHLLMLRQQQAAR